MEKIIVLVDFSKEAKNTVDYGIQFALEYDKEIEFLSTTLFSEYLLAYSEESKLEMEYRHFEKTKESFNVLMQDLSMRYAQLPEIDIEIQYGIKMEYVKKTFEEKNAELIITSGRQSGTGQHMVTEENKILIENCACPVMVVPPKAVFKSYKEMVYATDYNDDDIYLSRQLISNISETQSTVYGLHTSNSRRGEKKQNETGFRNIIKKNLKHDHFQIDTSIAEDIAGTIEEYAEIKGADIIAVNKENQEILNSFISINEQPNKPEVKLPLLIFNN